MNNRERDHPAHAVFDPVWWQEDPERWQLLRFEGRHDEEGLPVDLWWKDRQQVLHALIRTPDHTDADFARFLLMQETQRHGHSWGFGHSIEIAALLVAEHRHVEDVWLLWEAICRSFDTWCGLPHRRNAHLRCLEGGSVRKVYGSRASASRNLRFCSVSTAKCVSPLVAGKRHPTVLAQPARTRMRPRSACRRKRPPAASPTTTPSQILGAGQAG